MSSNGPIYLIYTNVWTSHVYFVGRYKYNVIFVDHFTHYVWFYHLKLKSQVIQVFVLLKALVENKFNRKIKILYTDNGGEFIALFLFTHDICYYTKISHTLDSRV